jgi:phosphoserine aminotransferase
MKSKINLEDAGHPHACGFNCSKCKNDVKEEKDKVINKFSRHNIQETKQMNDTSISVFFAFSSKEAKQYNLPFFLNGGRSKVKNFVLKDLTYYHLASSAEDLLFCLNETANGFHCRQFSGFIYGAKVSHEDAVDAIRAAMVGDVVSKLNVSIFSVHKVVDGSLIP